MTDDKDKKDDSKKMVSGLGEMKMVIEGGRADLPENLPPNPTKENGNIFEIFRNKNNKNKKKTQMFDELINSYVTATIQIVFEDEGEDRCIDLFFDTSDIYHGPTPEGIQLLQESLEYLLDKLQEYKYQ